VAGVEDPLVRDERGECRRELRVGQVVEINDEEGYFFDEDFLTGRAWRINSR
jgi:hypothetical protein